MVIVYHHKIAPSSATLQGVKVLALGQRAAENPVDTIPIHVHYPCPCSTWATFNKSPQDANILVAMEIRHAQFASTLLLPD